MGTAITPIQEMQGTLVKMEPQFRATLPAHIKPEKFIQAAQTSLAVNPDLQNVTRQSFYNACMRCAQDGLLPDGREAAIVKMKDAAAYMPMIAGVLKLIRNSGELKTIDAFIVCQNDEYDSWINETGSHFKFRQTKGESGPAIMTVAYAITKDGGLYHEEVTEAEMKDIQGMARSQNVWTGAFRNEMKKKSALHRLAKRMPKSSDIEQVFKADEELYDLEKPTEEKPAEVTTSSRLADAVVKKETVSDAVVVDKINPPVEQGSGQLVLTGVIFEKITQKNGTTNGKPWTKFGGKVGDQWFGTFDTKIADAIQESVKNRVLVNVTYTEKRVGESVYRDIVSVENTTIDQAADDDVPI